jgi:transcriptional regulator with XRE-family HTH domain
MDCGGSASHGSAVAQRSQQHVALGRAIRRARTEQRFTQEELAHRSGLHPTYVGGIERGERNPSYANILKLANSLGVRPWELLREADELER